MRICVWVIWDDDGASVCGWCRFVCGRAGVMEGEVGESVGVCSGTRRIIIEVKNNIVFMINQV